MTAKTPAIRKRLRAPKTEATIRQDRDRLSGRPIVALIGDGAQVTKILGQQQVKCVATAEALTALLQVSVATALIVDLALLSGQAEQILTEIRRIHPYLPILVLGDTECAKPLVPRLADGYLPQEDIAFLRHSLEHIAQLRRLERTVRQQNQAASRLFKVVERTANSVAIVDLEGRTQWINDGFTRLSGWRLEDIAGRSPHHLRASAKTDHNILAAIDTALVKRQPLRTRVLLQTRDSHEFWVDIDVEPLQNETGEILGFMFMELDISKDVERELRLKINEERLQLALWGTEDGLWDLDRSASRIFLSPAGWNILGLEPSPDGSMPSDDFLALVHPEDMPAAKKLWDDHLAGRSPVFISEVRMRHRSGSWRWILSRGKVVAHDGAGTPSRVTGTIRDNHQQVLAKGKLEEARQRAEREATIKGRFLEGLDQELRTPLNSVVGANELLMDTDLGPEQVTLVETSQRSAHEILRLLAEVLDYTRLAAHDVALHPAPFILSDLIDDVLSQISESAGVKELELAATIETSLPSVIYGDYDRIRQLLTILVRHAIRVTPMRSGVPVRLALASRGHEHGKESISVTVTDGGPVPEGDLCDLFQVEGGILRRGDATSLALASCRLLAETMHGNIEATRSTGGLSITASIQLESRQSTSMNQAGLELAGHRAVIACSHEATRASLVSVVNQLGGETCEVQDTASALAILEREEDELDMVILDSRFPGREEVLSTLQKRSDNDFIHLFEAIPANAEHETPVAQGASIVLLPVRRAQFVRAISSQGTATGHVVCPESVKTRRRTAPQDGGPRILVAEDDPSNRDVCLAMLRRLGHQCDSVANGREAVHAVLSKPYDLILMDMVMPVMDGIKAAATINDLLPEGRRPIIIALTASTRQEDIDLLMSAGVMEVLQKPVYKEDLANVLGKYLRSSADAVEPRE